MLETTLGKLFAWRFQSVGFRIERLRISSLWPVRGPQARQLSLDFFLLLQRVVVGSERELVLGLSQHIFW